MCWSLPSDELVEVILEAEIDGPDDPKDRIQNNHQKNFPPHLDLSSVEKSLGA